jgi:hypothetical protein
VVTQRQGDHRPKHGAVAFPGEGLGAGGL